MGKLNAHIANKKQKGKQMRKKIDHYRLSLVIEPMAVATDKDTEKVLPDKFKAMPYTEKMKVNESEVMTLEEIRAMQYHIASFVCKTSTTKWGGYGVRDLILHNKTKRETNG